MKFKIFAAITLLAVTALLAQDQPFETILTQALVLKLPWNQRTLSMEDPVEKAMVLGTWTAPKANDRITIGNETAVWESVSADTNGWFAFERDRSFRGLYLYVAVESDKDNVMLLKGMGNDLVYVNGELRTGNPYGQTDEWSDWGPNFNYSIIPIRLNAGANHLLLHATRFPRLKVRLQQPEAAVFFNTNDITLPDLIVGEQVVTWGSVVVVNASHQPLKNLTLQSQISMGQPVPTEIDIVQPLSLRKVAFQLKGDAPVKIGPVEVQLQLLVGEKQLAVTTIQLRTFEPLKTHKRTFISDIDGSVQYYAINPAQDNNRDTPKALVLSVHGAGVVAYNQAICYYGKTWAHIVAPTNRRPYGFNWEDWGRIDALEVLEDVQNKFNIDQSRIYLTGHSMGGHGSWHLGVTYPDQFAAIGPSAGYGTLWSYRGQPMTEEETPMQKMLMRARLPGNTMELAENFKQHGVYILHGAKDDNVPVEEAREMLELLAKFHKDFVYDEVPGQGHWWDISDEPGTDCIDWMPLFDFFARHARPGKECIRQIDFRTANPGISAQNNWLRIEAQTEQLKISHVNIHFDPGKNRFVGTTENVARLSFLLDGLSERDSVNIELDNQNLGSTPVPEKDRRVWLSREKGRWSVIAAPSAYLKGPHRYGTFKDAFRNRMVFVFGTKGSAQENKWAFSKARYDAEYFWYQGNGSIEVIADSEFDSRKDPDRNVILYGNAKTNVAWKPLLADSPLQVTEGKVIVGKQTFKGKDLAVFFIRPRPGSDIASVGVVAGTGIVGMKLTERRPYLGRSFDYPDVVVLNPAILTDREKGVLVAGFFGLDWKIESGEFVWATKNMK